MSEKKCSWIPYILVLLLIPGNVYLIFFSKEGKQVQDNVVQEYKAGGSFKDIAQKFKEGGLVAVQEVLQGAPDLQTGLILQKIVAEDSELQGQVKRAAVRLQQSGTLTSLEGRALLKSFDEN